MKKLLSILLIALMLIGCAPKSNALTDLLSNGYDHYMSCATDEKYGIVVYNMETDTYKKVTADMTPEKYEKFCDIDIFDDTQANKLKAFYLSLDNVKVEDLPVPDNSQFTKYKTVGDLENDGYENMGYVEWDGNWVLDYSNNIYELDATLTSDMKFEYFDDLSKEQRQALVIDYVEFVGFGSGVLD